MNMKKEEEKSERMRRVEATAKRMKELHPEYFVNPRPPRSRAKYDALKMIERKTGRVTGTIGNRVWVDDSNHSKGFYELDADGNEMEWFPYPAK